MPLLNKDVLISNLVSIADTRNSLKFIIHTEKVAKQFYTQPNANTVRIALSIIVRWKRAFYVTIPISNLDYLQSGNPTFMHLEHQ